MQHEVSIFTKFYVCPSHKVRRALYRHHAFAYSAGSMNLGGRGGDGPERIKNLTASNPFLVSPPPFQLRSTENKL